MTEFRYKAFISYSHQDRDWAAWLQRALETYRVPRRLVGGAGAFGPVPARIAPVFRDREDLSSAADLSASVRDSLAASECLVVVCSPAAAASQWVGREIDYFRSLGQGDRILALIVEGEPESREPGQACFPDALLRGPDGEAREPLAADARKWADGKLLAKLKLVAGILGIRLDDLRRRDMQRRQRTWMGAMATVAVIAVVMAVLAVMAITARNAAENRREHAEELVGYMVGDLKTKLDEVGRLDILEGMGGRVSEYLETLDPGEVTDESLIQQAKVWRQLGEVSMDQGDLPRALEAFRTSRDILGELHRRNPEVAQFVYELGNSEFWVGYVHLELGEMEPAENAFYDYLAWAYRLNELEPGNPEWLMEQSYAHSNLAAMATRRRDSDVAAARLHIEAARDINQQVIELAPDNATYLSEYGEVLAWLADTQMLECDLGGALASRQLNVEIAQQLMDGAVGNAHYRTRYAFALTGLANVAWQVGLTDKAIDRFAEARDLLGQLAVADASNLDLRFESLMREVYAAEVVSEAGGLEEARRRMAAVAEPLERMLESESFANQRRHLSWINYLLSVSDAAQLAGDTEAAAAALDRAVAELQGLAQAGVSSGSFVETVYRARFLGWQQRGDDLLARPEFADLTFTELTFAEAEGAGSCSATANRARQAILEGDRETAQRLTRTLLGKGYFEPGFIRVCRRYDVCRQAG